MSIKSSFPSANFHTLNDTDLQRYLEDTPPNRICQECAEWKGRWGVTKLSWGTIYSGSLPWERLFAVCNATMASALFVQAAKMKVENIGLDLKSFDTEERRSVFMEAMGMFEPAQKEAFIELYRQSVAKVEFISLIAE